MKIIDSFFLSVNDEVFAPQILTYIKEYLKCEQVFLYQLNYEDDLKKIIDFQGNIYLTKNDENYQIYQPIINYFNEHKTAYYTHHDKLILDNETAPLKRSELAFPIVLKTPEVKKISVDHDNNLWGILFIYDYNYLRAWTQEEIVYVQNIVEQLVIGIERNIIYKKLILLQDELDNCQIIDEATGLAKYNTFIDCLDYEWHRLIREKQPLSLILIGTNSPHNLLQNIQKELALIIGQEIKRATDLAASYDDRHIIIMLPNTDNQGVLWVNQQIMNKIEHNSSIFSELDYKSSIVTKIPEAHDNYYDLLMMLESPLMKKNSQEKIYNQNLV